VEYGCAEALAQRWYKASLGAKRADFEVPPTRCMEVCDSVDHASPISPPSARSRHRIDLSLMNLRFCAQATLLLLQCSGGSHA
jgi:hypothetical protein